MAYGQNRRVSVGELISGSFVELAAIRKEVLGYFAIFTVLAFLSDAGAPMVAFVPLASFVLYFVAQYLLYQTMLRRAGMRQDDRKRMISFFVMALVLGLPIYIGFSFFVVPGIILAAKCIMAPTYLVARDQNLFEAIGQSWRASESNTLQLSLAVTVLVALWLVLLVVAMVMGGALNAAFGTAPSFWIAMHGLPVLLMGLSMAAYRRLSDDTATLTEVFA